MTNDPNPAPDPGQSAVYQIRVKGHLGPRWRGWFEALSITLEDNGYTLLTGPVVDQAALHGTLKKIRDLGLPLVSVTHVDPDQDNASDVQQHNSSTSLERRSAPAPTTKYVELTDRPNGNQRKDTK